MSRHMKLSCDYKQKLCTVWRRVPQGLVWESISKPPCGWKEPYSPMCLCMWVSVYRHGHGLWVCAQLDLYVHLTMLVFQIPRQHLLHSAELLGPVSAAFLRSEIAFRCFFHLFFSSTWQSCLNFSFRGPKRSLSFHAPLFSFSKAKAKAGTATD